jgi:ATP-dependent RNA circularization protein (DNA/RNA ligase family)
VNKKIINSNYGSIPHLSSSKMSQQADKKITIGQELILTKKARDYKDLIIVTEKLDGSNVGVTKKGNKLIPITRSGYHVNTSEYQQHLLFEKYLISNLDLFEWLPENWRVCGEWLILAHGTIYDITYESPFKAFDIFDSRNKRLSYITFSNLCYKYDIPTVRLLHIGQPISIDNSLKILGNGFYGKPEKPEGVVYRIERNDNVDFLAKWVRSDKEDGKYLDKILWNIGCKYCLQMNIKHYA